MHKALLRALISGALLGMSIAGTALAGPFPSDESYGAYKVWSDMVSRLKHGGFAVAVDRGTCWGYSYSYNTIEEGRQRAMQECESRGCSCQIRETR